MSAVVAGAVSFFPGIVAAADQPNMEAALESLQNARAAIVAADACQCHGGHAGQATALIDQAIHEVREGIRYRNNH
jgi:hypothetical protein